jgi:hypothetical protein
VLAGHNRPVSTVRGRNGFSDVLAAKLPEHLKKIVTSMLPQAKKPLMRPESTPTA